MTSSTTTLYEKLGADEGIAQAVDGFYDRVTSDPTLAAYFTGTDMAALRRHLAAMLSAAAGGPRPYNGRGMGEAHGKLAVTDDAFDAVVGHLGATLRAGGATDESIAGVVAALAPLRSSIVTA